MVVGGYDPADTDIEDVRAFGKALGTQIIKQGHALINACQTEFDAVIAQAAFKALKGHPPEQIKQRLIGFFLAGHKPVYEFGNVLRSRLESWEPENASYVPEPVNMADVVIMVRGFDGARTAAWWGRYAKKPLLPVASLGGMAEEVFNQEIDEFHKKYASTVTMLQYQELNSGTRDWGELAAFVVSLAEDIATTNKALVIMSYTQTEPVAIELTHAFFSFGAACKAYGYTCDRVNETNTKDTSLVAEILKQIHDSAFVIADLTDLKQNVFFELGFARGLGKRVIVTAKEGTELPFDVKDMPVTFWDPINQMELQEKLIERLQPIAKDQGRERRRDDL